MSEKLEMSHQPENLQLNPAEIQFGPETGAINFDGLVAAYHGLRAGISEKRVEWAQDRQDKMERKDDLYSEAGLSYITGSRDVPDQKKRVFSDSLESSIRNDYVEPAAVTVVPRTALERLKISRMERQKHKLAVQRNKRKFHEDAFHIFETQDPIFRNKEMSKTRHILEVLPSTGIDRSSMNARLINKAGRLGIRMNYLRGNLSPEEQRNRLNTHRARIKPQETRWQKRQRRTEERAVNNLLTAVDQPILGGWRQWRRNEAVKDVQRHTRNANKHRRRQADALSS